MLKYDRNQNPLPRPFIVSALVVLDNKTAAVVAAFYWLLPLTGLIHPEKHTIKISNTLSNTKRGTACAIPRFAVKEEKGSAICDSAAPNQSVVCVNPLHRRWRRVPSPSAWQTGGYPPSSAPCSRRCGARRRRKARPRRRF